MANEKHKDEKEHIRSELSKLTYEKAINNITNRINHAKDKGIDLLTDLGGKKPSSVKEDLENIPVIPNNFENVSMQSPLYSNNNEPVMKYTRSSKGKRIDVLADNFSNTDHNYDYHFIPGVDQLTHHGSGLDGYGYRTMPQTENEFSNGLYTDYANEPNIPIASEYRNISTDEMKSLAPVINPMTAPTKERPFRALGRRPGSTMDRFARNLSHLKPSNNPLAEMKVKNHIETSTRTQPIAPPPVAPNLQLDFKF